MKTPKNNKVKYFLLAIVLMIIAIAFYAYKEYNRTAKDIAITTPAFTVTSAAIINEFTQNDTIANAKYLGKTIALNGNLKTVDKDESGNYTIVLGDTTNTTSVRCSMDSAHNNEASTLKEGASVNIKGVLTGFNKDEMGLGADIILNRSCVTK
jgi:DNA/RNA endonuclease YhcR with UshA esterase domain